MEAAPVVVETCRRPDETGFPFDETDFTDRGDRSFRSHIDDIVKRHPELAEHLDFDKKFTRDFPFDPSSNAWGGFERRGSGSRLGRPGSSRLREHFFSPQDDDDFETEFVRRPEFSAPKESQPPPRQERKVVDEKPPQAPIRKPTAPPIQQSNTVDLGQPQEPVEDPRGQRSMSAPPENKRFVSSINIPNFGAPDASQTTMPQQQPQQHQQAASAPQSQGKPNERVIPIHVEGRDAPVVPNADSFAQHQPQPQPHPQQQQQQQAPRGFGQRSNLYSKFNRPEPTGPYFTGDPFTNQRSASPHGFQQTFKSEQVPPQTAAQPQQQQRNQTPPNTQQQQQQPHQPPPPPKPTDPISQIQCIQKDVLELMSEVERFNGMPKDKQYLYLDEMLTRNLLKLDDVETEGKEEIRHARKEAINCIQKCIAILEAKALANEQLRNQLMQVSSSPKTQLEVSGVKRTGTEAASSENEATNMDIDQQPSSAADEKNSEAPTASVEKSASAANAQQNLETETTEKKTEDSNAASGDSNKGAKENVPEKASE